MLVTIAEVSTKQCPFVRIELMPHDKNPLTWGACKGSNCMAWRWALPRDQRESLETEGAPKGYCGLAGPDGRIPHG